MSEWRTVMLEDLASDSPYALATGPFGSAISSKHFVEAGVPVIRGSNLSLDVGVRLSDEGLVFLDKETADGFRRSIARRGDLVFTCWGTVGQVGLVDERSQFDQYVVSNKQMKITLDPERADSHFLYYLLSSPEMVREVTGQAIGVAVPGFNLGQLRSLTVRLPGLAQQRLIAGVLRAIDDLIENNRRRIELLEQMAQAIYREWFVHFRYPGHEHATLVDSPLGPIPEGWEIKPLASVASLTMGQSPLSKHYNSEGIGRPFHQGVSDFGEHFPSNRKYCSVKGRRAMGGDVLVSVRAPVGRLNIATDDLIIGRGLAAVRSMTGRQALLFRALKDVVFAEEDAMGGGTIFKAVGKKELEQIPMICATAELEAVAEPVLVDNLALIRSLNFANRALAGIRDLLLPKLVTGQIDVSGLDLDALTESVA